MGKTIIIKREIDELTYEEFRFNSHEDVLWFDSYRKYQKISKRHRKYENIIGYERLGCGRNYANKILTIDEVPLTPEIMEEARQKYINSFECKIWPKR